MMIRSAALTLALAAGTALAQEGTEIVFDPPISGGGVDSFELSADGLTIFFVGEVDDGLGPETFDMLYSVPVTGGAVTLLSDPLLHNDVDDAPIVGDGVVFFRGDQTLGNPSNDWFRVPVGGGAQTQITDNTGIAGDGELILGGTELIYTNDEAIDGVWNALTDGSLDFFQLTPIDVDVDQFQFDVTSDGLTLIYGSQQDGGPQPMEFGILPTDGSTFDPTLVTPTDVPDFFQIVDLELAPDDRTVVFTAEFDFDGPENLMTFDIVDGGAPTNIVPLTSPGQDIDSFAISPDGTMVAFGGDLVTESIDSLFVVNIDGTGLRDLTPDLPFFVDVDGGYRDIRWSPDGSRIFFVRDQAFEDLDGIFFVDVDAVVCLPDIDGDGELTIFDFLGFQNLFDAGDLAADFDGDGELTIFDFLEFQNLFDAGCP